jgi:hypothetical protein
METNPASAWFGEPQNSLACILYQHAQQGYATPNHTANTLYFPIFDHLLGHSIGRATPYQRTFFSYPAPHLYQPYAREVLLNAVHYSSQNKRGLLSRKVFFLCIKHTKKGVTIEKERKYG